jgi:NAD(P)-dependent dehydrogenase (short-subunit alcohol dehydrogenase family)
MSLKDKLILITGAASGIGLSTARLLASRGALLSLADYNPTNLSAAATELSTLTTVYSQTVDIRSTSDITSWLSKTRGHFNNRTIDGCANIAGFHPLWAPKGIEEISDEEFEETMSINTVGLFKCLRAQLAPNILTTPGSSIVNVGSVSGLIGFAGDSAYVASKHAAHGLTKCASKEAGERGIRVNCVAPGQTNTPMVQAMQAGKGLLPGPNVSLQRDGQPDEVAEVVVWLLSKESGYVTGTTVRVDGGMLE